MVYGRGREVEREGGKKGGKEEEDWSSSQRRVDPATLAQQQSSPASNLHLFRPKLQPRTHREYSVYTAGKRKTTRYSIDVLCYGQLHETTTVSKCKNMSMILYELLYLIIYSTFTYLNIPYIALLWLALDCLTLASHCLDLPSVA